MTWRVNLCAQKDAQKQLAQTSLHKKTRRRKSYANKHGKSGKEISGQNNYKYQGRKNIFLKKVPTPPPLSLELKD